MARVVLLFAAQLVAALILSAAATAASRVALVIGNSAYQSVGVLPNPANDARDMAAALQRLDFDVSLHTDLTYDGMRRALQDFGDKAQGADMAVVFYAGHGIEIERQNYLIPIDARLQTDRSVAFEAVPLDLMLTAVDGAKTLKVVLLDACRNNPFAARMQRSGTTRAIGRGLSRIEPATGTLVGFAAKEGTIANDGSSRNSPYTSALLQHIETPGLEISLMFRQVRDAVLASTGNAQEPFTYGSLPGRNLYFKPPANDNSSANPSPLTNPPQPQQPAQDRLAWDAIKDTSSIAIIEAFVRRFPTSLYADFARARIEELQANLQPSPPPLPSKNQNTPPPGSGNWFVILGSFPQAELSKAKQRQSWLRTRGLRAAIINANNYGNLSNGLYVVVLGPYDRNAALNALERAKTQVGDAYIKAGN